MSFNETEVDCDISRNVHVNSVFTKSHYETQPLILNSNDANNLEDKCAATESREVKQELYCQSFIIMQRSGINRVFLWFIQLIKICLNAVGPPSAIGWGNSTRFLCCKEIEEEKDVKQKMLRAALAWFLSLNLAMMLLNISSEILG